MKGMSHAEAAQRRERMKEYKAQGHSVDEVAIEFNVSKSFAQNVCVGICPQTQRRPKHLHNQFTINPEARIENCKRIIQEANPNLEYYDGFVNVDSKARIRCKVCGCIFERSLITFRNRHNRRKSVECPECAKVKKQEERQRREEDRLKRLEIERAKHLEDKQKQKEQKLFDRFKGAKQISMKTCPICHELFVGTSNQIYCSQKCRHQNKWHIKKGYCFIFPLEEVFKRDNGICYLCGKPCNWDDKETINGVIVYGDTYPSRDHVIPKSKGGLNTWDNIRLAHRVCNSLKSDNPLGSQTA